MVAPVSERYAHETAESVDLAFKISSLFKRSKLKEGIEAEPVKEVPIPEPEPVQVKEETPAKKLTAKKAASKKEIGKKETKKAAPKKETSKKVSPKKETKKTADKKTSKTASKKAAEEPEEIRMPPELKRFERGLKDYAAHIRTEYNSKNSNAIFTEYMAQVFRDLGHTMVLVRDIDMGLITMLGTVQGDSLKNKIVVICRFAKKGAIDTPDILDAQRLGAENRADETWCITTTEFSASAVRKARTPDAKVRLFDGRKLYKEMISKIEKDQ